MLQEIKLEQAVSKNDLPSLRTSLHLTSFCEAVGGREYYFLKNFLKR
jgi:hypothetical protein